MAADFGPYEDVTIDRSGENRSSPLDPAGDSGLIPNPGRDRDRVVRGGELRSQIDRFLKQVDELERAMTSLPHVENNGSSECPFAGDLYAKKEELEQQVLAGIQTLRGHLADLEREGQRCRANLGRIQADAGRLNLEDTQDQYAVAETEQRRQYREVLQGRDATLVALGKAEAVLKVSRTRKFPGGEPPRQEQYPLSQRGSAQPPNSLPASPQGPSAPLPPACGPGSLGGELDGLTSMGPLGSSQGPK